MIAPDLKTAGFSAREAAKQLVLLEDHLACPDKRCPDCISKHKLAAEAFAEEALNLEGANRFPWLQSLPAAIRSANNGQDYRAIRKDLTANLRDQGMIGLGRLRGPGLGQAQRSVSYWIVSLQPNTMDPVLWASSDPARKLGLTYSSGTTMVGQHIFTTMTPPGTVDALLRSDERVKFAEMGKQEIVEEAVGYSPGSSEPVVETRPTPGSPRMVQPGYIPRMGPGENGGKLTWDEKAAAMSGLGCGDGSGGYKCRPSAPNSDPVGVSASSSDASARKGLLMTALAIGAFLFLRR